MKNYDLIIIGAGASGLMSACLLSYSGISVLVIEKNSRLGRKLSATGNGRCNLTNLNMKWSDYYGDKNFISSVLDRVSPKDVIDSFARLGVLIRERDGYVYPHTNQAMTVVNALISGCDSDNIHIHTEETVTDIVYNRDIAKDGVIDVGYRVVDADESYTDNNINTPHQETTSDNRLDKSRYEVITDRDTYGCEILVMACGGSAGAEQGGSRSGYELLRRLGHTVTDVYPGLTGLEAAGGWWKSVAGTRVQGSFTLYVDGKSEGTHTGEIQITKTGVSGIPVFQLCRVAAEAISKGVQVWGEIDFVPSMDAYGLQTWIDEHGIEGLIPDKWIPVISRSGETSDALIKSIKHFSFTITDTYPIERAQVSAGGVPIDEVSSDNFESRLMDRLYILGELVDIDGLCGGYNLHLAWSSAILAVEDILKNY